MVSDDPVPLDWVFLNSFVDTHVQTLLRYALMRLGHVLVHVALHHHSTPLPFCHGEHSTLRRVVLALRTFLRFVLLDCLLRAQLVGDVRTSAWRTLQSSETETDTRSCWCVILRCNIGSFRTRSQDRDERSRSKQT